MCELISLELTSDFLGEPRQRAGFLVLAGFLGGFLFIRTSARLMRSPKIAWWPGSVETGGGLHIHHLVWGIVTMLLTGFLTFAFQPDGFAIDLLAVLFGIGAGLTLDEFALWLNLEDVYWAKEGRTSIDAVIVAAAVGGLVLAGAAPFDTGDGDSIAVFSALVLLNLVLVAVTAMKGKLFTALVAAFLPVVVGPVGAIRLAKPSSWWGRRYYVEDSPKRRRAAARHARAEARRTRIFDAVGGAPSR